MLLDVDGKTFTNHREDERQRGSGMKIFFGRQADQTLVQEGRH